jgi:hypothetical protein
VPEILEHLAGEPALTGHLYSAKVSTIDLLSFIVWGLLTRLGDGNAVRIIAQIGARFNSEVSGSELKIS